MPPAPGTVPESSKSFKNSLESAKNGQKTLSFAICSQNCWKNEKNKNVAKNHKNFEMLGTFLALFELFLKLLELSGAVPGAGGTGEFKKKTRSQKKR